MRILSIGCTFIVDYQVRYKQMGSQIYVVQPGKIYKVSITRYFDQKYYRSLQHNFLNRNCINLSCGRFFDCLNAPQLIVKLNKK